MDLPSFLTLGSTGEIRVTGHRIDLYLLAQKYNDGHTAEMLHGEYPTLPLPLIEKVIAFYLENQAAVDGYMAGVESRINRLRADYQPGPGMTRMRKLAEERARAREKG